MKPIFKPAGVLQTMRLSYQEICEGESPWIAIGNFQNDFFKNAIEQRMDLIKEPIEEPKDAPLEQQRWAAFCASSVEYLCEKYNLSCPEWTSAFPSLADPWFTSPNAHKPGVKESIIKKTPPAFSKRNVFCGDRAYVTKYEPTTRQLEALRAFEEARKRNKQIQQEKNGED